MRLKHLFISEYKNLKDFAINFDSDSFIEVFVGKNGTGKSNFFEALIEITRHLYEHDQDKTTGCFDYRIRYEIDGVETDIVWEKGLFKINEQERKTLSSVPLPDNTLIYYSGHNKTVADLVDKYEVNFRRRIKGANIGDSPKFIGIGTEYKQLLLALLLLQKPEMKSREYVTQRLEISSVGDEIIFVLNRPAYANGRLKELKVSAIEHFDVRTHYWGADGITLDFLNNLISCIKGEFNHTNLYDSQKDIYVISINIKLFQEKFSDTNITDIFRQFDNLKILGMLGEIEVPIKLNSGLDSTIAHFSDGQFQSIYIYSIVEIFKDKNCLTLLDEPDAFLHPEWQFGFLKQVFEITETSAKNIHVLMTSHSASTLCSLEEQRISLFKLENSSVSHSKHSKKSIIRELSDSFIEYSEDEGKLLIDNVIRSSQRPILFVEGPSDVSILNTAYKKLFPKEEIPILIQDAFDRGFIRTLLARDEIFRIYPQKLFFSLFDFDDAYDDWRELNGDMEVNEISNGLCKKLKDKNAYVFLLPIPKNELMKQVWDEDNPIEKIKPNPRFCIEHIFWGNKKVDDLFKPNQRNDQIIFKGDKIKFAREVVPTLDEACFETLRPMFNFIKTKI